MTLEAKIEEILESHLMGDYQEGGLQRMSKELAELFEKESKELIDSL